LKIDSINCTANPQKAIINFQLDNSQNDRTIVHFTIKETGNKDAEKVKVSECSIRKDGFLTKYCCRKVFLVGYDGLNDNIGENRFRCGKEKYKTSFDVCRLANVQGDMMDLLKID
jgi:hypothetical protein